MYTLYYSPGTASLVVHWLLIDLDLRHELKLVDFEKKEQKSPEYLKLNPSGVVPTLIVDGQVITEAAAMVLQIADSHPEAGLAPPLGSIDRARYYSWMFHLSNAVQPLFRNWYYADEVAGPEHVDAVKERTRLRVEAAFERIDAHLAANGPWLLGERMSAADFHLTMLMRWSRNLPKQAIDFPHLAKLAAAMKARPSFKALYASENLSEWA